MNHVAFRNYRLSCNQLKEHFALCKLLWALERLLSSFCEWSLKRLNSSTRRSWRFTRRWRTSWLIVMHINEFHRILFQVERPQLVRWKYLILERMTILYTFGNSSEIMTLKQPTSFFPTKQMNSIVASKCLPLFLCMGLVVPFSFHQYGNVFSFSQYMALCLCIHKLPMWPPNFAGQWYQIR